MQRSTVLIVDDDPYIVRFLQDALEEVGYDVATPLPTEAVDMARAMQPCVILLDLMMPLLDGAEVCRRLRLDPQTASIPVVIMSAQVHRLAEAESDDTLSKPFDLQDLYAVVERWAAKRQAIPAPSQERLALKDHGRGRTLEGLWPVGHHLAPSGAVTLPRG